MEGHARQPSIQERLSAVLSPEPPPETQDVPQDPVEAPADHEIEQETASEAPDSPVEATSEETEADAPVEQEASQEDDSEASEEVEEVTIDSLSKLAEYMEVDVSDLYGVEIPLGMMEDGKGATTTLGDLKDGAVTSAIAQKARQEAEEMRAALEQEQAALNEQFEAHNAQLQSYLQQAHQTLTRDFNNVNWQQLEQEDPGRYAAMRQQYAERNAELQGAWQNAQQEYAQYTAQMQQSHEQRLAKHLEAEQAALLAKVPEWQDVKVREAETGKLRNYLQETGFTADEVDRAYDHKMLVLARKAMAYDEMSNKADVAKKKVAKLGKKVLKSGTRQSKGDQQVDRTKQLRAKLRKSGRMDDAVDVISGLIS